MTVVVTTRSGKAAKLTHDEMDANFTDLETAVNIARPETITITADYTAAAKYVILADTTAGNINIPLPTAVGATDVKYWVKKVDSSASTVTVDPAGSETIDGALTKVLTAQWEVIEFISDGANWFIL